MKRTIILRLLLLSAFLGILGCATTHPVMDAKVALSLNQDPVVAERAAMFGPEYVTAPEQVPAPAKMGPCQVGTASYYHSFFDGRTTANGQTFSNEALTAASRTLRFGTRVRVTNLRNSKSVVVTINDRGPYVGGRIIDLTRRAANALGFVHEGLTKVRVETL